MDFAELATAEAHEAGAEVVIRHPVTGKPTDVKIRVKGLDSGAWRKAQKDMQRQILKAMSDGDAIDDTAEYEIDALVSITLGWEGIEKDGQEYKFSKKRCKELYTESPPVKDQVDAFVGKRANFTKG